MRCAMHSEREAVAVCTACGGAVCEECREWRGGRTCCPRCLERGKGRWFRIGFPFAPFGGFGVVFEGMEELFGKWCPECGRTIKADFVVCPYCTAQLKLTCQKCGKPLRKQWKACPYCGEGVSG